MVRRDPVNKPLLNAAIVLSGIMLDVSHYKLKPEPTEREILGNAQGMIDSTEWRGQIAPDFELRTTRGERFKLSENVGKKIIVLNFFATWCGPCRAEMPELNRYFNQHKSDGFVLVGIDAEEKQDQVDGFMHDLKLDFPAGIDQGAIQKQYGVSSLPTTVLIGVDGKVQFYESGALVNAEVAFDNLLQQNRQVLQLGKGTSWASAGSGLWRIWIVPVAATRKSRAAPATPQATSRRPWLTRISRTNRTPKS